MADLYISSETRDGSSRPHISSSGVVLGAEEGGGARCGHPYSREGGREAHCGCSHFHPHTSVCACFMSWHSARKSPLTGFMLNASNICTQARE